MIQKTDRTRRRKQFPQQRFPGGKRKGPEIEVIGTEQVEGIVGDRVVHHRMTNVEAAAESSALLQALKTRAAGIVQGNDLAVQQESLERKGTQCLDDLRKTARQVIAIAGEETGGASSRPQGTVSVQLELEIPARLREGFVSRFGQHQLDRFRINSIGRWTEPGQLIKDPRRRRSTGLEVFDGKSREYRFLRWSLAIRGGVAVTLLYEEPLLLGLLDLYQRPHAVQLVAPELEQQLPLGEAFSWITDGQPLTPIPHDHGSGSVVPLRDEPLEVPVLERMVLHVTRQALVGRIVGRPLGHRPGAKPPFHFETQVVMESPGSVLMHHKEPAGRSQVGDDGPRRLRSP